MGFLDAIGDLNGGEGLVHLSRTTLITREHMGEAVWVSLQDDYSKPQTPAKMCAITILNAALTHQRRIFALTRDGVEKMLRVDANWPSPPVFNTKHWSRYLLFMYERKMITKIFEGRVSIYELTFTPILTAIPERLEHKQHAIDFASRDKQRIQRNAKPSLTTQPEERGFKQHVPNSEELVEIDNMFKFDGFTDEDLG